MPTNIWEDLKLRYYQGNAVMKIIMVNVAVHVTMLLFSVLSFLVVGSNIDFWNFLSEWFYFPSDLAKIPFRFWTIFTYMFLHADFFHILLNLLVLYWFGQKLTDLLPQNKIFPIYLCGGIFGAIVFAIGFNVFPPLMNTNANLLGASASVMAIVLATATLNPKGTIQFFIIGAIELQYVALVWVVYNLVVIPGGNPGGALAHLGGAFMGWFFIRQLRKGKDYSKPINRLLSKFSRQKKVMHSVPKRKKQKQSQGLFRPRMRVYKGASKTDFYGNEYGRSFMQKYKEMSKEECLNSILSKIKRSGYETLTEDEKIFLDRYN
jgi:membrane associated rhomboid family serine protease